MRKRKSCQTPQCRVTSRGTNSFQGIIDPKKTKRPELSIMSMMVGKGRDLVFLENHPSFAKPTPAPKATRKSSIPKMEPTPTDRTARRR